MDSPTRAEVYLKSYEFRRERERTWRELDRLVTQAETRGIHTLEPGEAARLPVLYRATLSSVSVARAISLDRNLLDYLDSLSARAYFYIYGSKRPALSVVFDFISYQFPAAVRKYRGACALAAAFIILGAVTGFVLTDSDPEHYYSLVDEARSQGRDPAASTEKLRSMLYDSNDKNAYLTAFSAFLFTHNASVGILAFTLGFLVGIPVFILLFSLTGMEIGAMSALYHGRGLALDWWGWILPHGVTELLAITLCGGGGLVIAQSIIWPGDGTRYENLARRGRDAGILLLGAIGMFFIAGIVEGIFRQLVQDITIRYSVAAGFFLFWFCYFWICGRGREGFSRPDSL